MVCYKDLPRGANLEVAELTVRAILVLTHYDIVVLWNGYFDLAENDFMVVLDMNSGLGYLFTEMSETEFHAYLSE